MLYFGFAEGKLITMTSAAAHGAVTTTLGYDGRLPTTVAGWARSQAK